MSNLILLDASCLLNIYATGRMREIAIAFSHNLGVVDYVLQQEALFVWRPVLSESRDEQVPVQLTSLTEDGLVQVLHLEHPEEEELFVDLAAVIDDGKAMTGALALYLGCGVATDDRKARRILADRAATVPLISTLELLKHWTDRSSVAQADLRAVMLAMQAGATYVPRVQDPLYEWWREIVSGETC